MNPKIAAILNELTLALETNGGTIALPWHRLSGAPWTEGESAIDNPARAKELAAQFRNVLGVVFLGEPDREAALLDCDLIALDTTTSQQADDRLEGAGRTDRDSTIYQRMTGATQGGGGLGGRLRLMYPESRLADRIHAPGKPTASVTT